MASFWTPGPASRWALAGDGGLFSTAVFAVVLGLVVLAGSGSHVSNVVAGICMVAALALAPLLAWRLRARRADRSATGGALLGYIAGGAGAFLLLLLVAVVGRAGMAVGLFATDTDAGAAVAPVFVVIVAALLALTCVWLGADAVRDLSPRRRVHVRLDVARLAALVPCAAYVVGVIVVVAPWSGSDAGMNAILLLASPGLVGAVVVTLADVLKRYDERRTDTHLISGA
jgi:hypothetical protein